MSAGSSETPPEQPRGPPWRWCWGRKGPGRKPKPRVIWGPMARATFIPIDASGRPIQNEPVCILPDEFEALRLVYLEGLTQDEAAKRMNVSRGTLWRALDSGRKKLVRAIVELRPIILSSTGEECR